MIDQFDAVILIRIVTRRDHDSAVEIIRTGDIGDTRRRRDVQKIRICSGCCKTRAERILKHVARAPCVFTDHDPSGPSLRKPVSQIAADLEGMIDSQIDVRFPAEAVSSKVFAHNIVLSLFSGISLPWRL